MTILFRADGGAGIGSGHLMRCLALAQACAEQESQCVLLTRTSSAADKWLKSGMQVREVPAATDEAEALVEICRDCDAKWVVIDGYQFDGVFQQRLRQEKVPLLYLDDMGYLNHYYANAIVNQNSYADGAMYAEREPDTKLLLGSQYALLRREFDPWFAFRRSVPPTARRVLVSMGGGDSENVTLKVIQACAAIRCALSVDVIAGEFNPHVTGLKAATQHYGAEVNLIQNPGKISEWMARADLAIVSAGSISWELCFMGVPMITITTAANQERIANDLQRKGAALSLGWHSALMPADIAAAIEALAGSQERRSQMSAISRTIVDGEGAGRVAMYITEAVLRLRPAKSDDCELLWNWANDPGVRRNSFRTDVIPWNDHQAWLEARLKDRSAMMLIGIGPEGQPVGQVRFEGVGGPSTYVNVSVAPESRGRNIGSLLIRKATDSLFRTTETQTVHAFIKPGNIRSETAFQRSGFRRSGEEIVHGEIAHHYLRERTIA